MAIFNKIKSRVKQIWQTKIAKAQYPMLTSICKKQLKKDNAIGIVYMLHHIAKKDYNRIPTNEDLKVSPAFLESIIKKYKKAGFNFISLDTLSEIITSEAKPKKPFIAFTIDDGYLDNYTQALPVFERYQVPFTIFVATDFVDQKAILWWDSIEDLILQNNKIKVSDKVYPCRTIQEKWNTFRILRERILQFDQKRLEESLHQLFSYYNIDWHKPIREKAMSWEQIKTLSKHPLCTIGGHTVTHPALNKMSDDDFRKEVRIGIEKLESITGQKINHFAYPYGSPNEIGEREFRLINEFNFKTAFIAYGGCITEENKNNITHLPRVYLHER